MAIIIAETSITIRLNQYAEDDFGIDIISGQDDQLIHSNFGFQTADQAVKHGIKQLAKRHNRRSIAKDLAADTALTEASRKLPELTEDSLSRYFPELRDHLNSLQVAHHE